MPARTAQSPQCEHLISALLGKKKYKKLYLFDRFFVLSPYKRTVRVISYSQRSRTNDFLTEVFNMKGYDTSAGYMGYVNGKYMLFVSEEEYREYLKEQAD